MMGKKIEFKIPELETVEIKCSKENLVDSTWLFNNIPWSNHDGKNAKLILDEPTELFLIDIYEYDTSTSEIKNVTFDNVMVLAMHGFGGTSYLFDFRLGDDKVVYSGSMERYGFSKEEVKSRFLKYLKNKVKGLKYQLKRGKKNIESIKNL